MSTTAATLVLGGTGRSGSLVAQQLKARGIRRTAARNGAEVRFDWDDQDTYKPALAGMDRAYLVTPILRTRFAGEVAHFLDRAAESGIRHVTLLSVYDADQAPVEADFAAVERDVASRDCFAHTILRPAWVMQNFIDQHLPVMNGALTVPTGSGSEAFVDAADIAAVAVESLLHPQGHAGRIYAPTGPQSLTMTQVAEMISTVAGTRVVHGDLDPEVWIAGAVAAGFVPADYAIVLRWLTDSVISGRGTRPNNDIADVTGRAATSFEDFARRNLASWAHLAAA